MAHLGWVLAGGAFGTFLRLLLMEAVDSWHGSAFPWGTWTVNLLGSFGFGLCFAWAEGRWDLDGPARAAVFVGFLGAFTTFSTLAFQTVALGERGAWLAAAANLLGQNLLGLAAVLSGLALGRVFPGD